MLSPSPKAEEDQCPSLKTGGQIVLSRQPLCSIRAFTELEASHTGEATCLTQPCHSQVISPRTLTDTPGNKV